MKNKRPIALLVVCIIAVITVLQPSRILASSQEALNQAQQEKTAKESTLQDTRNLIADLESKKEESETYLNELNTQLGDLQASLASLNEEYNAKQAELLQVQQDLESAKQVEAKQYDDMKLRIRYMYENSESGALETLLSSENFSDFLSRAQNMTDITDYDRKMLGQYEDTRNQVADKEQQIKDEQQAIADIQTKSLEKQAQIQELYSATYNQVLAYESDLTDAEGQSAALIANIKAQEDSINELMVKAQNEEVERQKAEAARVVQEAQAKYAAQTAQAEAAAANAAAEAAANAQAAQAASQAAAEEAAKQSAQNQSGNASGQTASDTGSAGAEEESTSSGGQTLLGRFTLTAYCPCSICCGVHAGGPTASGAMPTAGRTVAMGGVPFGTKLMINGQVYTVEDRGTAYGHVDIYFSSHSEALAFGMRSADVYQVN